MGDLHTTESELEAIRKEVGEVGKLGKEERDILRSYGSQITALRRDIVMVKKQTEFEINRRKEIESMIDRETTSSIPPEHLEAVRRRERDIEEIKAEKAAMLEWLQRGVSEAQRITMQVEALKASGEAANATESELQRDTRRLQQMQERLRTDTEEAKAKIAKMKDAIQTLEEHREHQISLTSVTEDILRSSQTDVDRLSSELASLRDRARDVETIEVSVGCLAASVRRAQHTLDLLHLNVMRGEEPVDDDGYDSEEDADGTNLSPVVMSSTKAKIGRCDALLVTLWSSLKTFEQDQKARTHRNMQDHEHNIRQQRQELNELRKRLEADLEAKRKDADIRIPQLKGFIAMREKALQDAYKLHYSEEEVEGGLSNVSSFNLLKYIEEENKRLQAENADLRVVHDQLEGKVAALDDDYSAVRELKRRYRDLEAQKTVLSHSIKECEGQNRELKFYFHEEQASLPARKKKEPWRVNQLETSPLR